MANRLLEASRRIPIPATPYTLYPDSLPFAFLFACSSVIEYRREGEDDDPPQPTWSNPETTIPDSNDPENDEEIDWLKDD